MKVIMMLLIFVISTISSQYINLDKKAGENRCQHCEILNLAGSNDIDIETLLKLASHENPSVRLWITYNTRCPKYVLERLSSDTSHLVKSGVAGNPRTPMYILIKLSEEKDDRIKRSLAHNPNTPLSILMRLAKDDSYSVRAAVAEHPNVSGEIIKILLKDEDKEVRLLAQVANPEASDNELAELSKNQRSFIRSCVAKNKKTPLAILYELAKDEQLHVRCDVAEYTENPNLLEFLSNDKDELVLKNVANNKYCFQETLIKLVRGDIYSVKEIAIENPNTPLSFLEQLAKEGSDIHDWNICYTIMERPDVSKEIVKIMAKDKNKNVCSLAKAVDTDTSVMDLIELSKTEGVSAKILVAENIKTPPQISLSILYQLAKSKKFDVRCDIAKITKNAELLEFLSNDKDVIVVEEVANNINCSEKTLAKLAKDDRYDVRWAVSMNPSTPEDVLLKEFNSDHEEIKENAKNNLKKRYLQKEESKK